MADPAITPAAASPPHHVHHGPGLGSHSPAVAAFVRAACAVAERETRTPLRAGT